MSSTLSGWEIVDQEKCKLVYAKFFDGVQCFDEATGNLQLLTPDFEQSTYDNLTKTFTTTGYSLRPVTVVGSLNRPIIQVRVDDLTTGIDISLEADSYTKYRTMPIYYIESCGTTENLGLTICLSIVDQSVVTKLLFSTGTAEVKNNLVMYSNTEGYRFSFVLLNKFKQVISLTDGSFSQAPLFIPNAFYYREVSLKEEQSIIRDFGSVDLTTGLMVPIRACSLYVLNKDRYNSALIFSNTLLASLSYIELSNNKWNLLLRLFDSFSIVNNRLQVVKLILMEDGTYESQTYIIEFNNSLGSFIPIASAQSSVKNGYTELLFEAGFKSCMAIASLYTLEGTLLGESKTYGSGYPSCEDYGSYNMSICDCSGGDKCLDKLPYNCEYCNPETGTLVSKCSSGSKCTVFGCFTKNTYYSTCSTSVLGFPRLTQAFLTASCYEQPFKSLRITFNGDVYGIADLSVVNSSFPTKEFYLFNMLKDLEPFKISYPDEGLLVEVNRGLFLATLLIEDLESFTDPKILQFKSFGLVVNPYSLSDLFEDCTLDWASNQTVSNGWYSTTSFAGKFISLEIDCTRDGRLSYRYKLQQGFIPSPVANIGSLIGKLSAKYEGFCNNLKYLGTPQAFTLAVELDKMPKYGTLTL